MEPTQQAITPANSADISARPSKSTEPTPQRQSLLVNLIEPIIQANRMNTPYDVALQVIAELVAAGVLSDG